MPDVLRHSIKKPIAAIFDAYELLSSAVDAHLKSDYAIADALFRQANKQELWDWLYPEWRNPALNLRVSLVAVTKRSCGVELDPLRNLRQPPSGHKERANKVRAAVLERDGYCCRYCGIPVVDPDIRKIAHQLYPDAVPWPSRNIVEDLVKRHQAFQRLWLQYDHVVPYSHGGLSSEDNIVISCALCNYGKDKYTFKQLCIADPQSSWDGLERLRLYRPAPTKRSSSVDSKKIPSSVANAVPTATCSRAFFLPGAWLKGGYLYTPPIGGKERWFKLGPEVTAEPMERNGVHGCRLVCNPTLFRRRQLSPESFLIVDQLVRCPGSSLGSGPRKARRAHGQRRLPPERRGQGVHRSGGTCRN